MPPHQTIKRPMSTLFLPKAHQFNYNEIRLIYDDLTPVLDENKNEKNFRFFFWKNTTDITTTAELLDTYVVPIVGDNIMRETPYDHTKEVITANGKDISFDPNDTFFFMTSELRKDFKKASMINRMSIKIYKIETGTIVKSPVMPNIFERILYDITIGAKEDTFMVLPNKWQIDVNRNCNVFTVPHQIVDKSEYYFESSNKFTPQQINGRQSKSIDRPKSRFFIVLDGYGNENNLQAYRTLGNRAGQMITKMIDNITSKSDEEQKEFVENNISKVKEFSDKSGGNFVQGTMTEIFEKMKGSQKQTEPTECEY